MYNRDLFLEEQSPGEKREHWVNLREAVIQFAVHISRHEIKLHGMQESRRARPAYLKIQRRGIGIQNEANLNNVIICLGLM